MFKEIPYCELMYLRTFGICALKYMSLILLIFFPVQDQYNQQFKTNEKVKIDLLTDIDILLMIEKAIRREYATLFIDMQKLPVNDFK